MGGYLSGKVIKGRSLNTGKERERWRARETGGEDGADYYLIAMLTQLN